MTPPRLLFYVQHLLGIGHQRRAATITRALGAKGIEVAFVSGGMPVPHLDTGAAQFFQLPPVRATDLSFKTLVDANDRPIDAAWKQQRAALLLQIYQQFRPQIIMLELFPFGRRQMRFELLPLLQQARLAVPRVKIVCSLRDILVQKKRPERQQEMLQLVETYFDYVLVHGDPNFVSLDRTFAHSAAIADKLIYTGYVLDQAEVRGDIDADAEGKDEVLVSTGGSYLGEALLQCAAAARLASPLKDKLWRLLVNANISPAVVAALHQQTDANLVVEPIRGDFPALLQRCALSISQGGYNTLMETLNAGCPAVIIPYAGGKETEQTLRAHLLADQGFVQVVEEAELSPQRLNQAIVTALQRRRRPPLALNLQGAEQTADIVADWLAPQPVVK